MGSSMGKSGNLSFGEFLADIRFVIASPTRRFPVILERGALWGSIFLLVAPVYFGFGFSGGVYFDRDPFPGYSFFLPAVLAAGAGVLKAYFIHFFGRMFEGRWRYSAATGRFREMLTLFGYSSVPGTLVVILATLLFLSVPGLIGAALRDFRALAISIFIAIGVGLFVWSLILFVLAMRLVYPMRDYKIVAAFITGSVAIGVLAAAATTFLTVRVHIQYPYVQPIVSSRVLGFLATNPEESQGKQAKLAVDVDRIAYRFKLPRRFDLVAFAGAPDEAQVKKPKGSEAEVRGKRSIFAWHMEDMLVGRIVGLPGDTVELVQGALRINGRNWAEPYIPAEFQTTASLPPVKLGDGDYYVLPDNRCLIEPKQDDWIINLNRIAGRVIVIKWPIGWAIFRSTAFLHAYPLAAGTGR